jgi:putative transposase
MNGVNICKKPLAFLQTTTYVLSVDKTTYKFRLQPTAAQETLLKKSLELCRWTYNETLATRKNAWETEKKSLSRFDTYNFLPKWKTQKPELSTVHSQVLQNTQERVDLAFRAFFQRVKKGEKPGYPRFKGFGRYDSLTYPQYGNGVVLNDEGLHLSKIGLVKINLHREIPANTVIKRVTIKREAGQWFATLSVVEPESRKGKCGQGIVGIDLGCKTFITLSDGTTVENPKFLGKALKRIAKAQKKLAKQTKGTPERAKARKVLGKAYQKVNNQRNDFLHQTSRKLANKYEVLVFENLDIKSLVESKPWHSLNRTILDSSWGRFVFLCSYKAENAGGKVIAVNPKNTSKMCSRCGAIVDKDLSCRVHSCPHCGLVLDRDLNASINILRLGQKSLVASARALAS